MALIPIGHRTVDQQATRPQGVRLVPVDGASAVARPDAIGDTYLELEHDARGLEQQHLFAAEGERRARSHAATASSLGYTAEQLKSSVERARMAADKASARTEALRELLVPYVWRKATSSIGYFARTGALLIGDVAGLSGAAIALGEYPALAIVQAISAGTATVTAGLAATQLRHLRQNAERTLQDVPKPLEPYRHLFSRPSESTRARAAVLVIAMLIALFVSVGVFALRMSVEGALSGLTFGALAAAIAMASFINSWYHADAVADIIESAGHDARQADRRHRRLSRLRPLGKANSAELHSDSIVTEHTHRGLAAAAHLHAEKYRALRASPDVVGHGLAPAGPDRPLRRARSA